MNALEREMKSILTELKEAYGVFELKAEFEAEGSRMVELMRLKDVASSVDLPIILKIGGKYFFPILVLKFSMYCSCFNCFFNALII